MVLQTIEWCIVLGFSQDSTEPCENVLFHMVFCARVCLSLTFTCESEDCSSDKRLSPPTCLSPQLVDFKIQRFCLLVYPFHFVTGPVFDNVSLFTAVLFMHTDEHWGYTPMSVCLWRWGNLATRKLEKEKKVPCFLFTEWNTLFGLFGYEIYQHPALCVYSTLPEISS